MANGNTETSANEMALVHKREVKNLLLKMESRIGQVLGPTKAVSPERFMGIMLTMASTPDLLRVKPENFIRCALRMANIGLDPDPALGLVYPVRYGDDLKPIIGYRGYVELALRSELVDSVQADVVWLKADRFVYRKGLSLILEHEPNLVEDLSKKEPDLAYAVAKLKSGEPITVVLRKWEIYERRDRSEAWKYAVRMKKADTPWHTDTNSMWRKTAVRALEPWLPKATELRRALALDADASPEEARSVIDVDWEELGGAPEPKSLTIACFDEAELAALGQALKMNRARVQHHISTFQGTKDELLKSIPKEEGQPDA